MIFDDTDTQTLTFDFNVSDYEKPEDLDEDGDVTFGLVHYFYNTSSSEWEVVDAGNLNVVGRYKSVATINYNTQKYVYYLNSYYLDPVAPNPIELYWEILPATIDCSSVTWSASNNSSQQYGEDAPRLVNVPYGVSVSYSYQHGLDTTYQIDSIGTWTISATLSVDSSISNHDGVTLTNNTVSDLTITVTPKVLSANDYVWQYSDGQNHYYNSIYNENDGLLYTGNDLYLYLYNTSCDYGVSATYTIDEVELDPGYWPHATNVGEYAVSVVLTISGNNFKFENDETSLTFNTTLKINKKEIVESEFEWHHYTDDEYSYSPYSTNSVFEYMGDPRTIYLYTRYDSSVLTISYSVKLLETILLFQTLI